MEFYHLDALGSVRAVSNEQGQIVSRHEFLPFGEEWTPGTPQRENKLFTGKERDPETGLDYFGARYYDSQVGRFTTIDPVYIWSENLVDPQRWNRYAYVRNNPLKYTDPDGRCIYPGSDCAQFALGVLKAIGNIVPDSASLVNGVTNVIIVPFTNFQFSAAPRFEPTNLDQERGMVAANFMLIASPFLELAGSKLSSAAGIVAGKATSVPDAARGMAGWLGDGAKTLRNDAGDVVFLSKDGTRRIRFDINRPSPHANPHGHVEELVDGKWNKSGPIYPKEPVEK